MSIQRDTLPVVRGAATGAAAWVLGYLLTYVLVAPDLRNSSLNRIIEAFDGAPATYEMVGWVFYNAHFVSTVFQDIPFVGGGSVSYVGGEGGFTALLYGLPIALLFAAGLALARADGTADTTRGALVGATALPGYLALSIAGVFLFAVSVGSATGAPDRLAGVFLAGIVYPALCAAAGGVSGAVLEGRGQASSAGR
ncbi:hypothetical protein ACFR9U_07225 [Halorientalis brevis]|uniref:DUF7978 domain-containing protein n=1 Tax=Halorientalis brevis TaxID=1126241 RepID=A0ABD6C8U6_9EURY|nr:hypothetical protein [Halorientalis brevis]